MTPFRPTSYDRPGEQISTTPSLIALSISWKAISDWEMDQKEEEDKTILLFLPKDKNKGFVLRNKGYTESIISSSEYLIDENENLNIKTIYSSTAVSYTHLTLPTNREV